MGRVFQLKANFRTYSQKQAHSSLQYRNQEESSFPSLEHCGFRGTLPFGSEPDH